MIYITEKNAREVDCIRDVEYYFNANVPVSGFDAVDEYIIKRIDDAVILDRNANSVVTKFGATSGQNLSTGCKAVLLYNYMVRNNIKKGLNITECGENALKCLFDITVDNKDNIFVLNSHLSLVSMNDMDYNVDGKVGRELWLLLR